MATAMLWNVNDVPWRSFVMGVRIVRRLYRLAVDRHRAAEKLNHRITEDIVAITCNHVAGARDIDVLGVRTKRLKVRGTGFA